MRKLVLWLEEEKISAYEMNERDALKQGRENWDAHFTSVSVVHAFACITDLQYLQRVGCALQPGSCSRGEIVDWLVDLAIDREYHDKGSSIDSLSIRILTCVSGDLYKDKGHAERMEEEESGADRDWLDRLDCKCSWNTCIASLFIFTRD